MFVIIILLLFTYVYAAVEFLGLHAAQKDDDVILDWSTATETENAGFILERKTDSLAAWSHLVSYLEDDALRGQGTVSSQSDYTFTDTTTSPGTYYYRISGVDLSGALGLLDSLYIELAETAIKPFMVDHFNLSAYPNPFNPTTRIRYELSEPYYMDINIYSVQGRLVRHLYDGVMVSGVHDIVWDAGSITSGLYILTLRFGHEIKTLKLIVLR